MMVVTITASAEAPFIDMTDASFVFVNGSGNLSHAVTPDGLRAKVGICNPPGQDARAELIVEVATIPGATYTLSGHGFVTSTNPGAARQDARAYVRIAGATVMPLDQSWEFGQELSWLAQDWGLGWEVSEPMTVTFTATSEVTEMVLGLWPKYAGVNFNSEAYFGDMTLVMLTPAPVTPVVPAPCEPAIVETAVVTETTLVTETVAITTTVEVAEPCAETEEVVEETAVVEEEVVSVEEPVEPVATPDTIVFVVSCQTPSFWRFYVDELGGSPTDICVFYAWLNEVGYLNPFHADLNYVQVGDVFTVPSLLVSAIPTT